jgi:hypothetical protein
MAKTTKKKTTPRKKKAALVIRHSGIGSVAKTRNGVALTCLSNEAEAREAGLRRTIAAKFFPKKKSLCETVWTFRAPKGFEGILPSRWFVGCADAGCAGSNPNAYSCDCNLYSSGADDPSKDKNPRDEGRRPVEAEEGRWYKCMCDCTYSD